MHHNYLAKLVFSFPICSAQ